MNIQIISFGFLLLIFKNTANEHSPTRLYVNTEYQTFSCDETTFFIGYIGHKFEISYLFEKPQ